MLFVDRPSPLLALARTVVGLLAAAALFLPLAGPLAAVAELDRCVELALDLALQERDRLGLALELLLGEGIHRCEGVQGWQAGWAIRALEPATAGVDWRTGAIRRNAKDLCRWAMVWRESSSNAASG